MQVNAPAKINLTLHVLGKRPDGFHELESVMQMLTLADTLTMESDEGLHFTCSDPALENEGNLVLRAARLLHSRCPSAPGARIHLEKRIPAQAGLGGGSSDAAATLAALNEMWQVRLSIPKLAELAAELGSDVPFFLYGPTAVVRGRGEQITPAFHPSVCHVVLAKPSEGLSTPEVYRKVGAKALPQGRLIPRQQQTHAMLRALGTQDPHVIARALVNDLEIPAMRLLPELQRIKERMYEQGCLGVLLSGSGSALFGICADAETARHAALDLTNDCPWTWAGPWQPFR